MPQVQIQITTWNSKEHLPRLFASIRNQTIDYDLLVIDNASSDGTVEWLADNEPSVKIIKNNNNRGFSGGHNQGFAICATPFVLILNPDVELNKNFLEKCLSVIQGDERIGTVTGKLYRRLPTLTPPSPLKGEGIPGIIDSCGLKMMPWGQVINIGEGQEDKGQFDNISTVFGSSGACALYRLSALKSVADKDGIFDERFGSYKEDVDLSWRLQKADWKAVFTPSAIAQHSRAIRRNNRDNHSDIIRQLSIRNHILMLKKNLSWRDWFRLPLIIGYELIKLIYLLLFEKRNLKAYKIPSTKSQIPNNVQNSNDLNSKGF